MFQNLIQRVKNSKDFNELKSITLRHFVNGQLFTLSIVRRQLWLALWIVVLFFYYINNRYETEMQISTISRLNQQLVDARYENLTISAELEEMSRKSKIYDLLQERGLQLNTGRQPPILIE